MYMELEDNKRYGVLQDFKMPVSNREDIQVSKI